MKRSLGLRNYMLATGSFRSAIAGTVIHIYGDSSPAPASANDSIGASVLLCTISLDGAGGGVSMEALASGGTLTKNTNEVWSGDVLVGGRASFFRMQAPGDAGGYSDTAIRLQGDIGLIGADLNFSNTLLVFGDARRINFFVASVPAG